MESIITALITGGLALIGVIFTNVTANKRVETKIEVVQAITNTKITELTREVREHNNFAKRMPVVEEKIDVANHRIANLEKKVG